MKGSPILSTITATLLMAGAYLWLHLSLYSSPSHVNQGNGDANEDDQESNLSENMIAYYIEAHFSTPPSKFVLTHPVSGKVIVNESTLTDNEWSGEIMLSKEETVELNIRVLWKENSSDLQNFIQLILSPDQMEDSSVTLRNDGEIDSTATFQLRK